MDCEGYEALAVDLLYGELSPEKRADAQAHAAGCPECGKLSKELDEARHTASSLPSRIAPPPELDERIMLAARMAADVRKQPLRGSGLHVAAAAVLAALLTGVSFVVGMQVGRPKVHLGGPDPEIAVKPKDDGRGSALTTHGNAGPEKITPNTDREQWRKYLEDMLTLANEDLAKGDTPRALKVFGGVYSSGGKTPMALEARLGMARCYRTLGQLEDARSCAKDAFTKNDDWGTHFDEIDREAMKLVTELNRELDEQQKKKLQQR